MAVNEVLTKAYRTISYCQHPVTRHSTSCNTLVKDTTNVVVPPPTLSDPLVSETHMPWICAMCVLRYDAATVTLHSVQLTYVFFLHQKLAP